MINLIKNELSKIFHKKFIYIILGICVLYMGFTNFLYSRTSDTIPYYMNDEIIELLKEENDNNSLKTDDDITWYIDNKTQIEVYDLTKKYGYESWQATYIDTGLRNIINTININTYSKFPDKELLLESQKEYNRYIELFDKDDWKTLAKEDKKLEEDNLKLLNEKLTTAQGVTEISNYKKAIYNSKLLIEAYDIQLEKDIAYNSDFYDTLNSYISDSQQFYEFTIREPKAEEKAVYENLKSNIAIEKYTLDTMKKYDNEDSARGVFINFYSEYSLLILIIVVVIGGIIVSEEFNKGTIKLLLIKPYKRWQILLAKYLTTIIIYLLTILVLFGLQYLLGIIFLGNSDINLPVLAYNFGTDKLEILNVFKYFGIMTLANIPQFILVLTLAFALSTMFGHSAVSLAVTFLGYTGSSILNMLVIYKDIKFMKYFVTLNWDFTQYLFGASAEFKYVNLTFSSIICSIYLIVMLALSFIIFNKKNIKNI